MNRRSPADDLPDVRSPGSPRDESASRAKRPCLSEDEAFEYVQRPASGSFDSRVQEHLDTCENCRVLVVEAARALAGGESQYAQTSGPRDVQPLTLSVGEVIVERYEIIRFAARGGMGEVYEARDSVLHEVVALKTLVCTALDDPRAMNRLLAEVRLARHVTHPNVCRILEFGSHHPKRASNPDEVIPFLTMEFLHGETLDRKIAREGKLDPAYVATLLPQIIAGVSAIHAAGIVHRDIKPQNMFLLPGSPERLVLTDFGLARGLEANRSGQSMTGPVVVGTLDYMAPEQLEGKPPTPAFDIYALGVVIFEMLTGRKPFAGATALATAVERFRKAAPRPSELVPGLDSRWDAIVARCLAQDPARRFQRAEEIVVPDGAADQGIGRRRWVSWPIAALLGAGALAGFLGRFVKGKSADRPGGIAATTGDAGAGVAAGAAAGKPAAKCADESVFPYVVSAQYNTLYRFDPVELKFSKLGMLKCPTAASVNAMTVDRNGYLWVNYLDEGKIYKVNLKTLACESTPYVAGGGVSFSTALSMQFLRDSPTSEKETLYVSDHTGDATNEIIAKGIAKADLTTMLLTRIGPFTGSLTAHRCELSGTPDGKLFGFFEGKPAILAEIDPRTGATPNPISLANVSTNGAYAFSSWGGNFWLYTTLPAPRHTMVTRYDPKGGEPSVVIPAVGFQVLAAGVSSCAPTEMPSASRSVVQVAAGAQHTCVLLADGSVRCWGDNSHGQLGYGHKNTLGDDETPASLGPVDVGGHVRQIITGDFHTCALLDAGKLRCWGNNSQGQLGYGHTKDIGDDETPASAGDVDVGGVVRQVSAGGPHTCAVLETGKLRCWGRGDGGHLGYGNKASIGDDETPASAGDVDVGGRVAEIAAGSHTCALLETGNVRCWGGGSDGRLGYASIKNIGKDDTPAAWGDIKLGGKAKHLSVGHSHSCALLDNGKARCWGSGAVGQLGYEGNENIGNDETPASVGDIPIGAPVKQIIAGGYDTCALLESGRIRCWGVREGTLAAGGGNYEIGTVKQIALGGAHTCVLLETGKVRCWGDDHHGQLGSGHSKERSEPITMAPTEDLALP
jgi:alpha-tubulin suppressor-like RCC1 family protein